MTQYAFFEQGHLVIYDSKEETIRCSCHRECFFIRRVREEEDLKSLI